MQERDETISDPLEPTAVVPRLSNSWLGQRYLYFAELESTNTTLAQLAADGAPHGTVVVADSQRRGRGRLDRSWHSPPGTNLYFSVLLRPGWSLREAPPLSLAAGVAVAEALEQLLVPAVPPPGRPLSPPELKWPNDVLHAGRKIAGILIEAAADSQSVARVVLGIGVNVNQDRFPDELSAIAGSLRTIANASWRRADVLVRVLARLEFWLDQLEHDAAPAVLDRWQQFAPWIGKTVKVSRGDQELVGTALGLAANGALRLRATHGREYVIHHGDASLRVVE